MSVNFIRGIENYPVNKDRQTIVTIGTYDGIHLGHQEILKLVMSESKKSGCEAALVTFHPHPKVLVAPEHIPLLLTSLEEKTKFIPDFFDGNVLIMNFSEELQSLTASEFVQSIIVEKLKAKKLIVGYDHAFGKDRSGNIDELKRLGEKFKFDVEVVGPVHYKEKAVSSSRIRKAILKNDYQEALKMLGHHYAIYGKVERGLGLGRKLGYPTANVCYSMRKLLPVEGVYACWAEIGDEVKNGMMFIGKNHFNPQQRITVEANLFDFDKDIYDQDIIVYPTHFVRENRKFESTDLLVEQIKKDKLNVMNILKQEKENDDEQRAKSSTHQ